MNWHNATMCSPNLILIRSEERFSRNAETDLVCRLLLEKKKTTPRLRRIWKHAIEGVQLADHIALVCYIVDSAVALLIVLLLFFFNDTATTEIYTLSLHDALPIWLLLTFVMSLYLLLRS